MVSARARWSKSAATPFLRKRVHSSEWFLRTVITRAGWCRVRGCVRYLIRNATVSFGRSGAEILENNSARGRRKSRDFAGRNREMSSARARRARAAMKEEFHRLFHFWLARPASAVKEAVRDSRYSFTARETHRD